MNSSFRDKLHFTKISLGKNAGPLLLMLLFMLIGAVVIYIGLKNSITFLWIFGAVLGGVPFLVLLFTMPSSFLYYYEQAETKKYGTYATAEIVEMEEKDVSYFDKVDHKQTKVEEFQYFLTYMFKYNGNTYQNKFLVASKRCFEALPIGAIIPIKFLKSNPNKSTVRNRKMANELGLPLKECQ